MMNTKKFDWKQNLPVIIFITFILWFLLAFIINPVWSVLVDAFTSDAGLDFSAVSNIFGSDRALNAIKNSFILAFTLTVTCNIVGIFAVFVTEYFDLKGSWLLSLGYNTVLIFGGLIINNGYILTYGETGFITSFLMNIFPNMDPEWFQGYGAVLFVMTIGCTNIHMMFLRNAVKGLDYNIVEAAQNLGSSQWEILRKVVLPSLKPMLLTLIIMTFQTGLGAMSAPLMVGGRDFQTISPLILTFAGRPGSRDLAAVLSLLLGVFQIILLVVISANERRGNYMSISKTKTRLKKAKITSPVANVVVHVLAWGLWLLYVIPFLLVVVLSFMDFEAIRQNIISFANFTVENYASILSDTASYQPFVTSVIFSAIASVLAVIFMTLVARLLFQFKENRFVQSLEMPFFIPWLLPALLMALGLILAYDQPSFLLFGNTTIGKLWVLPLAYMIVMLPSTLRYIKASYYSFDSNLEEASQILGASGVRTFFKVIIPALLPTILALIAINFNGKLDDYDLSAFLYQPSAPTLGIVIRSNSDPQAAVDAKAINLVYSVILMAINAVVIYFVYGSGGEQVSKLWKRRKFVSK